MLSSLQESSHSGYVNKDQLSCGLVAVNNILAKNGFDALDEMESEQSKSLCRIESLINALHYRITKKHIIRSCIERVDDILDLLMQWGDNASIVELNRKIDALQLKFTQETKDVVSDQNARRMKNYCNDLRSLIAS